MTTDILAKLAAMLNECIDEAIGETAFVYVPHLQDAIRALTAQAPAITDHEIETLAHRMCWRYKHSSDPAHSDTYTFNRVTLQEFARKLMQGETE